MTRVSITFPVIKPIVSMARRINVVQNDAISTGIELLSSGCVIAVPTDTLYGLACDASNIDAINKMYEIKSRNERKPVAICFGGLKDIESWAQIKHLPDKLLNSLLPGPVTLLLHSVNKVNGHLCSKGKVGIRVPNYPFIQELANGLGRPLALTSANLSDKPSAICCTDFQSIWDRIPLVFDGGITNISREGSTIVDLSDRGMYNIIRKGVAYGPTVEILTKFKLNRKIV